MSIPFLVPEVVRQPFSLLVQVQVREEVRLAD